MPQEEAYKTARTGSVGLKRRFISGNKKKIFSDFAYQFFMIIFVFFMFYPVLWLISSSFKGHDEVFIRAHALIPLQFNFDNYVQGWGGFGGISFSTFFSNTFIIVISTVVGQVVSSSLVAFGFSRVRFAGKKWWFALMMATMLLPAQVIIIPQFILFNELGWINSWRPLIVPAFFGVPFFVFLMMQFMQGIPYELDESAVIDGCGKFRIFSKIILPLIVPAIVTTAIFSFFWTWDSFFAPLIYLQNPRLFPISLALRLFSDPAAVTNWGAKYAMSVLSLIPSFVIFLVFQRYLVEGISTSGLKV